MLEKDIADLVQDADSMRRIFLAIRDNLSSDLIEALTPLSIIEDHALKVRLAHQPPLSKRLYQKRPEIS